MMLFEAIRTIVGAIAQLVALGAVGFWFVRRAWVRETDLKMLSDAVIKFFLPLFMFSQIVQRFSFSLYPDWWVFPILSFLITACGYFLGSLALAAAPAFKAHRGEFLGVTSFQNSGYLPLPLVAALLPAGPAQEMFIYIFLFLIGFNMTIFSFGFCLLSETCSRRFNARNIFNAPVMATLLALVVVFLKADKLLPPVLIRSASVIGRAAIPLSILVVGGNLASLKSKVSSLARPLAVALGIKLVLLPLIFLGVVLAFKFEPLLGLFILLQAAMPPAALLSVISKSQDRQDHLVHQAIFYGHLASIVSLPVILILFWMVYGRFF
ncbi:MAG: AEC family transporter [Candidatus Omnitrophota bacterium]